MVMRKLVAFVASPSEPNSMTESVNGNGSPEPTYTHAVETHGRVWNGGNCCQLEAGVASIKSQLEAMRTAQNAHERFATEQLRLTMGQQAAQASLNASKQALTNCLRAGDYEGVADSITGIIDAVARWYRSGGQ